MNLLTHMRYMEDSKIRPSTLIEMGGAEPEVAYVSEKKQLIRENPNQFFSRYNRGDEEQRAAYDVTLDKINEDFKKNWPTMNDTQKMKWKYQRYMQDYLATISSVDDNVGRVLDYLDESGLSDNTIVIYTSDQGFYLGEHGWFDKRFIYDESFKTPLLIRWPNKIKAGITNDEMVQNLDFAQTFLEAAGIDTPNDMQGESLIPLLTESGEDWTRDAVYYHYYEYPSVHMVKRHYGIVNKDYKLVRFYYDVDEWELYDRKNDPNEMNNVYNDPEYSNIVSDLKIQLAELRKKYKDSEELDQKFIYKN